MLSASCSSASHESTLEISASEQELTCADAVNWEQWRRTPRHTAYNQCETTLRRENVANLQAKTFSADSEAHAIWNHGVFVGNQSGSSELHEARLDSKTGAATWKLDDQRGRMNVVNLAVGSGIVWAFDELGIRTLDAKTGADIGEAPGPYAAIGFDTVAPVVQGKQSFWFGILEHDEFLWDGGFGGVDLVSHLISFDAQGQTLWDVQLTDSGLHPSAPALADGTLFVPTDAGVLRTYSAATGQAGWTATTMVGPVSAPVVQHGRVFVNTELLDGTTGSGQLEAYDEKTGAHLWSAPGAALPRRSRDSALAASDDVVYVTTNHPGGGVDVAGYDAATGQQLFSSTHGAARVSGAPALTSELLFFGSSDGHVYAIDAHTGNELANVTLPGAVSAQAPLVVDGRVFVWAYTQPYSQMATFVLSLPQ